jgi:hypothetical protein
MVATETVSANKVNAYAQKAGLEQTAGRRPTSSLISSTRNSLLMALSQSCLITEKVSMLVSAMS